MRIPSPITQLAGQTAIYGLSSVAGRMLNYLLVVIHTRTFHQGEYGAISDLYAYVGFLVVIFTYGLETAFFRFSQKHDKDPTIFGTALRSITISSLFLGGAIVLLSQPIADLLSYSGFREYIMYFGLILALDAIAAIPFAKLRADNRPGRFAFIKLANIGINIGLNALFLVVLPWATDFQYNIGHVFLSNLIASGVTLLLLLPQMRGLKYGFKGRLWKQMLLYGSPLIITGLAGMTSELLDRPLIKYLSSGSIQENLVQVGIYSACYKLSLLMTFFIQAYRYAAEPFFFAQSSKENAPQIYATTLKYFVIVGVFIFLLVSLFIDVFKYIIGSAFHEGLFVVPILLIANLFLGIYYNLSVWYKLKDKTIIGAMIATVGAALTIGLNIILIPQLGYEGSAWTTLAAYFGICALSYLIGQRYYRVPYSLPRIGFYILLGLGLFLWSNALEDAITSSGLLWGMRVLFLGAFVFTALVIELGTKANGPRPNSSKFVE